MCRESWWISGCCQTNIGLFQSTGNSGQRQAILPMLHCTKDNRTELCPLTFAALLACVCGCLLTGCASRAYVIARHNAQYHLSPTNRITIADHAHPAPEEQSLRTALLSELRQQGFNVVASTEAEYTLTYWIDISWKRGKIVIPNQDARWSQPVIVPGGGNHDNRVPPRMIPAGQTDSDSSLSMQHVVEVPWETKGIRLKVFPQASMRAGNLQTAWDGYIEVGDDVSEAREPVLVRTLLNYFGTDFVGKATLITAPTQEP